MATDWKQLRDDYHRNAGEPAQFADNPWQQFDRWFKAFCGYDRPEPHAMTLSTCSLDGKPSSRVVLMKEYGEQDGIVFYTNLNSRKGKELHANPNAALSFYWHETGQQVRIEGEARPLSSEQNEAYFASRPRGSQIGAWASPQSHPIPDRDYLEIRFKKFQEKYPDVVPRPQHWGGYSLRPNYFEFWEGRSNRLHNRITYTLSNGVWSRQRLAP